MVSHWALVKRCWMSGVRGDRWSWTQCPRSASSLLLKALLPWLRRRQTRLKDGKGLVQVQTARGGGLAGISGCLAPRLHMTEDKKQGRGFPGGAVVKNLPADAGDRGSIHDPARSHMPWNKDPGPQLLSLCSTARELQVLRPRALRLCSATREATAMRRLSTTTPGAKPQPGIHLGFEALQLPPTPPSFPSLRREPTFLERISKPGPHLLGAFPPSRFLLTHPLKSASSIIAPRRPPL